MRGVPGGLALALFGALLVLAAAPAVADDDILSINVNQQTRLGPLVLEPGDYYLIADMSRANHRLVLVMSHDLTRLHGLVLAQPEYCVRYRGRANGLLFGASDWNRLEGWVVGDKGFGYSFTTAPVPAAMAARGRQRAAAITASVR